MAGKRKTINASAPATLQGSGTQDMEQLLDVLGRQVAGSLSGVTSLANGLNGFNERIGRAARLVVSLASDGEVLVSNLSGIVQAVKSTKAATQGISALGSGGGGTASSDATGGQVSGSTGSIFGAVMGGLGAAASLASGIFGIFRRRREEEKKYRREIQAALDAQLTGEIKLSLATSQRLADEQAITREKYKQIEAGLKTAQGNRQSILSQIDSDLESVQQKLGGRYSAAYKRNASNYYNALLELKQHFGDLDWLESVGAHPLIASGDQQATERYQVFYERLLALARQEEQWKEQQKQLADDLIGSSAQSLADSWVEAFRQGEEATWDFAKNFEDVMRQAIVNGFSDTLIAAQINPIFDKFRQKVMDFLAGEVELDQVITPELEQQVEQTAEKIKQLSPQLRDILEKLGLEVDNTSAQTLSASIRGVSEQTASLVAGQMNAIRTQQVKSMEVFSQSLSALVSIESNTRYNRYLESIDRRLAAGGASSGGSALRAAGLA